MILEKVHDTDQLLNGIVCAGIPIHQAYSPRHTLTGGSQLQRQSEMQEQYFSVNCGTWAGHLMRVSISCLLTSLCIASFHAKAAQAQEPVYCDQT